MENKEIYFCVDVTSYFKHICEKNGGRYYYDYLQTKNTIRRRDTPIVTTNMALFNYKLIDYGYDIYLCYDQKELKIEQDMTLPVRFAGKDGPKVIGTNIHCTGCSLWVDVNNRQFDSLLEAFQAGLFHEALGIETNYIKELKGLF